ncbi:hypothetical protein MARINON1_51813 [Marinobacter salarius]|nr:hypothetical protein MBHK15_110931 [Marinobacter salarius]VXB99213.1 hypothetical protein MARINON1_51813 [Marinobacter salarius]
MLPLNAAMAEAKPNWTATVVSTALSVARAARSKRVNSLALSLPLYSSCNDAALASTCFQVSGLEAATSALEIFSASGVSYQASTEFNCPSLSPWSRSSTSRARISATLNALLTTLLMVLATNGSTRPLCFRPWRMPWLIIAGYWATTSSMGDTRSTESAKGLAVAEPQTSKRKSNAGLTWDSVRMNLVSSDNEGLLCHGAGESCKQSRPVTDDHFVVWSDRARSRP